MYVLTSATKRRRALRGSGARSATSAVAIHLVTWHSPGNEKKSPPERNFLWGELLISLGPVDLSRIPSGAFFREDYLGSEMASQNDQNKAKLERKLSNHGEPWRFAIGAV